MSQREAPDHETPREAALTGEHNRLVVLPAAEARDSYRKVTPPTDPGG